MPCGQHKNGCVNCGGTEEVPFRMFMPFSMIKAGAGGAMRIGGICSTQREDQDGELVKQDGLDFTNALKSGFFNDNHSKETAGVLGIPDLVRRTTYKGAPATYVEGNLIGGYEPAQKVFQLAKAMQNTKKRRLGFSLQGKVLRREGPDRKIIAEARVDHIAITAVPVNADTTLQVLSKSLDCETHRRSAQVAMQACAAAIGGLPFEQLSKALTAGAAITNPGAAPGEGFPLRMESLEGASKKTTYKSSPARRRRKKLSKAQALDVIRSRFGDVSSATAERIIALAQGA